MTESVSIDIDLTENKNQLLKIEIQWKSNSDISNIKFPTWTPGSYKTRDHAQYLFDMKFYRNNSSTILPLISSSEWQVSTNINDNLRLKYKLVAKQKIVRSSFICENYATLCLASTIPLIEGFRNSVYSIRLKVPKDWIVYCPDYNFDYFNADNYDDLVDKIILCGHLQSSIINVKECQHRIVKISSAPNGWPDTLEADTEKICIATCNLLKSKPPSLNNYVFAIQMLENGYGGLEHNDSSFLHFNWKLLIQKDGYRKLLQLIAHEYLHQWNVRRLRPSEYVKYNYQKIILSDSLWFAEGVTSYFDIAIPYLAGLVEENDLLNDYLSEITYTKNLTGSRYQSLANSSREASIKLYNSDKSSLNYQISYYRHGAILALCLDIELRLHNSSLSELLRKLWDKYSYSDTGYTRNDIKLTIGELCPMSLFPLDRYLDIEDSLIIEEYLIEIGIKVEKAFVNCYSGFYINEQNIILRIEYNSPASDSGLIVGDEIIAINKHRVVTNNDINSILIKATSYNITIFRDGYLMNKDIILINQSSYQVSCLNSQEMSSKQSSLRKKWLTFI